MDESGEPLTRVWLRPMTVRTQRALEASMYGRTDGERNQAMIEYFFLTAETEAGEKVFDADDRKKAMAHMPLGLFNPMVADIYRVMMNAVHQYEQEEASGNSEAAP